MNAFADQAVALARRGFRVFPLIPGTKRPAIEKWQKLATTDEEVIRRGWGDRNYNIGIATGNGIVGIDIDVKDGRQGEDSLAALGLPQAYFETLIVRTPSGGRHLYFKGPDIPNSASSFGAGIDVRGSGGYLVAPGSVLSNGSGKGSYTIEHDVTGELHDLWPGFLRPVHERVHGPAIELDDVGAVGRAREYLLRHKPAIEGQGGDDHTYRTACQLKDFGVSEGVALQLLVDHWNERCLPPWTRDDLAVKVGDAYRYGQNSPGSAHPAAVFSDVLVEPDPKLPVSGPWKWHGEPVSHKVAFLYKNFLPLTATAVMVGAPNAGKTFLEMELARSLATGKPFFGMEPKRRGGTAFLFAGSEGSSFVTRMAALEERDGLPIAAAGLPDMTVRGAFTELVKELRKLSAEMEMIWDVPLRMVVLETLAASGLIANENDNGEMGRLFANFGKVAEELGVVFMVAHHPPKGGDGLRGGGAAIGGVDYIIEIKRDGRDNLRRVELSKARDCEQRPIGAFTLLPVHLGDDEDGDPITSMTVSMGEAVRATGGKTPSRMESFMRSLEFARDEFGGQIEGELMTPLTAIKDEFFKLNDDTSRSSAAKAFDRCKEFALNMGVIESRAVGGTHFVLWKEQTYE